ncbi:MAG: hypothetical protein NC336_06915 [Clostridium sp.]|nr:hypothetical protein [Clostridium sp.]
MGFAQEMVIHGGAAVTTTRPPDNRNQFRALCLDTDGALILYESRGTVAFGDFIKALLSRGVSEALYTDMGPGWNYCFYRESPGDPSPRYLHDKPLQVASNFLILRVK